MEMDEMTKAEQFDQFLDALSRNPHAVPPRGIEPEVATIGRKIAVVENEMANQVGQNQSLQAYIWQRALAGAEAEWQVNQKITPTYTMSDRKRRLWLFPLITIGLLLIAWLITLVLREPEAYRISKVLPPTPVPIITPTLVPPATPPVLVTEGARPSPTLVLPPTQTTSRISSAGEFPTVVPPGSTRKLEDFKAKLNRDFTVEITRKVFGVPDDIVNDSNLVYIYKLPDGSQVLLGFHGNDKISYAYHKLPSGYIGDLLLGK